MSNAVIDANFSHLLNVSTDMVEHMPKLKEYASQCQRVVEFGVRDCTSTWGFLAGNPKWMRSYDIIRKPEVSNVEAATLDSGIDFKFVLASSIETIIDATDLLFIDSLHTYEQLKKELSLHHAKVSKYVIMHDTTTFGELDERGLTPGLWPAIEEFITANPVWSIKERLANCNGLTVLRRC